uniref:Uncharacterized protein n=1 Tax=Daphnia galeata TaxID=27404 RepID=A0A8J2RN19_9CRUS|nr:unnamed protein product [Daphnia galeata]
MAVCSLFKCPVIFLLLIASSLLNVGLTVHAMVRLIRSGSHRQGNDLSLAPDQTGATSARSFLFLEESVELDKRTSLTSFIFDPCHYVRQGKSPDDSLYSSTVALLEIDSQGPCAAIETADSSK